MLNRLSKPIVAAALVLSLAGQWALLQPVAWVGMLVKYSQQTSLAEAIAMTFDGEHPCELCRVIKAGKAQERDQHQGSSLVGKEIKLQLPPPSFVFKHPAKTAVPVAPLEFHVGRIEPPPTPPPRAFFA